MTSSSFNGSQLFGLIRTDEDLRILEVNATLLHWLDYGKDDLVGRRFDTLLDRAGSLYFDAHCLPHLGIGQALEEIYLNLVTRTGAPLPVLLSAARSLSEGRTTIEVGFARMARRARIEDELVSTKKQAIQANEAKGRFLRMISHDLRNPLQSISMSVDLLLEENLGPLNETQRELLQSCQEAGTNLGHLISDILDFERLQSGQLEIQNEAVSANECLSRTVSVLKPRLTTSAVTFEVEELPEDVVFSGEMKRVQQILLNLITNALKFTPTEGRISLRLRRDDQTVCFEVEDTGCGMQEDDLERIFQPFIQVGGREDKAKGLGLGLAISRELAQAMAGTLQVRSAPGQGSTFTLTLPLQPGEQANADE
ncbi:MAG: PAS domain-containing sensor histidine kinase [Verrucomicrobiota bacterium JB023]|nr:PAS domain-containing sensor histidine kinase [Verrucomicrobiota bacterium JB023]